MAFTPKDVRAWLLELFFRSFFRLLLVAVAVAQWVCVAWLLYMVGDIRLPLAAQLLAIAAVVVINRRIVGLRKLRSRPGMSVFLRVYSATAFVALFCAAFLGVSAAGWVIVHALVGGLSAQALPAAGGAVLASGYRGAFDWSVSLGMGSIGLLMLYGYTFGQRQLRVNVLSLGDSAHRGRVLRVAQISDVHVGQNLTVEQLRAFVRRVNDLAADLVFITGDVVDSPRADCEAFLPEIGRLSARHGVYAILGNHDHRSGPDRVARALERVGVPVLRDEGRTLDVGGFCLHVIGLDDRGRDWARGVESCGRLAELLDEAPDGMPVVLLSHRPDVFPQAAERGVFLTLSGHTHGGQLAVPWIDGRRRNLAEFITSFDRGLYRRGASYLYVNCGLGVTGQRIRLFTPREITLFEIRCSEAEPPSTGAAGEETAQADA